MDAGSDVKSNSGMARTSIPAARSSPRAATMCGRRENTSWRTNRVGLSPVSSENSSNSARPAADCLEGEDRAEHEHGVGRAEGEQAEQGRLGVRAKGRARQDEWSSQPLHLAGDARDDERGQERPKDRQYACRPASDRADRRPMGWAYQLHPLPLARETAAPYPYQRS